MTTLLQEQAQQTIADSVLKNTYLLIEALKQNYVGSAIRGHYRAIKLGESVMYHENAADKLKAGDCPIDYVIESGRKYHKIVFIDGGGQRSVHAFVDKKTGEVYKSASWRSPAKGERYNLLLIKDREWLFKNADWSSGYLYKR